MTRIRHIRRLAGVLAGLVGALLAFVVAAPAALASTSPGRTRPLSWADPPLPLGHGAGPVPVYQVPARTAVTGGLPGWQIALIAAAAALAVATVLVLPDRGGPRAARRPRRAPEPGTCPGHPGNLRADRAGNTHPPEPVMTSALTFLDCPAYLDRAGAQRCGLPAEVKCRFTMESTSGPLDSAMIRCPAGHWFTGPIESLTLTTGPGRAATLPCPADQGGGQTQRAP